MYLKESALCVLDGRKGYDAYVVPTDDNHQSEYVGEHFKARAFITGFTGPPEPLLSQRMKRAFGPDGRYFIQAGQQLAGSGVKLFKMASRAFLPLQSTWRRFFPREELLDLTDGLSLWATDWNMKQSRQRNRV